MNAPRICFTALLVLAPLLNAAPDPANLSRATLNNGLRVVVIHSSLAPVVTTVMNYLVASNEAPNGFPGMAHALEHVMFRGGQGLSADQLANIAAAMGGNFNADTQQSATQFFFTVPKQDLDVALHIESIRMQNLLATDVLWNHERGAIEQEVARDFSNPQYVFYTDLLSAMFRGTPYAHDALGTRPSFDASTGAMLQNFYSTWYAPNNAVLVIAGDVDGAATISEVKDLFGSIPAKTPPARPDFQLDPVKGQSLKLTTDLPYGLAVTAFRWPGSKNTGFAAAQVLADVLLAANERRPALPESAFKIVQRQVAASVAGELRSPGYLTQHALQSALLPKDDPDLRYPTPASVSSLSLEKVRTYYRQVFRPDLTTIVVKVTPEQARTVIARNFGAWKAEGPKPDTLLPPVPRNAASGTAVPNASRVLDEVTLAEMLPLNRSNPDCYALNLGDQVLGGSFYASRLSRDLRENAGLVYSISSTLEAGPTRAIPLSEASTDSIAAGLLARVRNQLPLDEPALAAKRYVLLTAPQVKAAFVKWIRPGDLVQVTQGPNPK